MEAGRLVGNKYISAHNLAYFFFQGSGSSAALKLSSLLVSCSPNYLVMNSEKNGLFVGNVQQLTHLIIYMIGTLSLALTEALIQECKWLLQMVMVHLMDVKAIQSSSSLVLILWSIFWDLRGIIICCMDLLYIN